MRTIKVSKKTRTLRCKNNSYNHDHISYNIFLQTTKLSVLSFRVEAIQIHSFKARRLKLCMQPLIIVGRVMGGYEAGLRGLRGHWGRGLTEGLGRFASQSGWGERGERMGARRRPRRVQILLVRFLLAPLEFPKLANAQPSNFGPLPYFNATINLRPATQKLMFDFDFSDNEHSLLL